MTTCPRRGCDAGILVLYEEVLPPGANDPVLWRAIEPETRRTFICCPDCHADSTRRAKQVALASYLVDHDIEVRRTPDVLTGSPEARLADGTVAMTGAMRQVAAAGISAEAALKNFRDTLRAARPAAKKGVAHPTLFDELVAHARTWGPVPEPLDTISFHGVEIVKSDLAPKDRIVLVPAAGSTVNFDVSIEFEE